MAEPPVDPFEACDAGQDPAATVASSISEAHRAAAASRWLALVAALPSVATHEEVRDALDAARGERAGGGSP
jgi:hypothetical protein